MERLVFDADGLIKLAKSGILGKLAQPIIISRQVFEEVVVEGKRRLFEDAFLVEDLIERKIIQVKAIPGPAHRTGFGKGELSSLALYRREQAAAIVTDDRKFITLLEEENIPFLIPTEIIVALAERKRISTEEAKKALGRIMPFVREGNYNDAWSALGGKI